MKPLFFKLRAPGNSGPRMNVGIRCRGCPGTHRSSNPDLQRVDCPSPFSPCTPTSLHRVRPVFVCALVVPRPEGPTRCGTPGPPFSTLFHSANTNSKTHEFAFPPRAMKVGRGQKKAVMGSLDLVQLAGRVSLSQSNQGMVTCFAMGYFNNWSR